ncbi:mitochondrial fission ELM1 family protein [Luteimonas kalidii]|uniref:Mitochondrial fission ELM1 family protein n=1 Tax=Luteimonas kalidii TaxID=3042025 RepID=A0ABT6JUX0_9GAMM|nr:mitochondrial fission ELM1 family protein [Luteimonas kalidii]MDH5834487.1 mitochondrial fission ELM1 family protein [Luteimonas kalidii]
MERAAAAGAHSPQIWSLSDGRAGNARQADALADALGGGARRLVLAPRAPWRWAAPHRWPAARYAFGPAFAEALAAPPALAIGCGRQAALATRLLGARGARTVQILDPRIDTRHWDLLVVPEHDDRHGDRIISLLGSLHPVDDAWLADARQTFAALADLPAPRTVLLVGGPTAHAPYDRGRLDALCGHLVDRATREGGSVLGTVSRRTPADMGEALQRALAGTHGVLWHGAGDGPNPYPGLLAWADRIVCSPDSVNMVSEACATRVPVHVFDADRTDGRPRRFLEALRARGRIGAFDVAPGPRPELAPLRETGRVAEVVRQRLGWG